MNKKTILLGLAGIVVIGGIGYYLWKKSKKQISGTENKDAQKNISTETAAINENWKKIAEQSANKLKIGNVADVLSKTAQKLNTIKPISSRGMKDE